MSALWRRKYFGIAMGIAALSFSPSSGRAGVVTFADGTFTDSDWELLAFPGGAGGSATVERLNKRGNHQSYRTVKIALNAPTTSTEADVTTFSGRLADVYNPSQGAIQSVDFRIDAINISQDDQGQRVGAAVKQDGHIFIAPDPELLTPQTGWVANKSQPGLTAAAFHDVLDNSTNPNFTASGSSIEFGFFNIYSAAAGSTAGTRAVGLDNWSVTLNTGSASAIPLPTPLKLGLVGLACAGLAHMRRGWLLRTVH